MATVPIPGDEEVTVPLGRDRRLAVRPVTPNDVGGLVALYDEMDGDDRQRRFFCAYRPQPSWFVELARPDEHGGARIVAELTTPEGTSLVGEAGYVGLPDGNGELALLVARRWRGWLGPYLLDRLVRTAAERGIPDLEADVLTTNGPMLALFRRRGAVVMNHDGWSTVRLRIGTSEDVPTWDGVGGAAPRLLIEAPGGRWAGEDDARAAGLSVLACFGPSSHGRCPALDGRPCPLATEADAVVLRYPPGDEAWEALIDAHRRVHPDTVVLLEAIDARPSAKPAEITSDEVVKVATHRHTTATS